MAKMIYSNNMAKVDAKLAEVTTEAYRKRFIFKTGSNMHYVYGDKRYKYEHEARNALINSGYKNGDIRILQQWGGYRSIVECAIIEGYNSEWVDLLFIETDLQIKNLNTFKLPTYGPKLIRVYKDFKFKSYYKENNEWCVGTNLSYYRSEGVNINNCDDDQIGLRNKTKIFSFMPLSVNDITSETQLSTQNYNNYRRNLSQYSKNIILKVFEKCTEYKIRTYTDMREFFRRPGVGSCEKAAETKRKLINEEFLPILEKIKIPTLELNQKELDLATSKNFKRCSTWGYYKKTDHCFHRFEDWIIYSMCEDTRIFYNVKTQKRYAVNYYNHSSWREQCNIGIFRSYDLISSLSQYGHNIHGDSVTLYLNGEYCYYGQSAGKTMLAHYDNIEYKYAPRCYNENNEEISPMECFKDTIVPDFLEAEENVDYKVKFYDKQEIRNIGTFKDIINLNRCPGIAFLLLCVKNDRRVMSEQLYKLGLNGMLVQLLINPNSFKEKTEKDDEISYWRRSSVFCNYDKKGTNLKKMFSISMDKIKTYDKALWTEFQRDLCDNPDIPSISMIQNLIGDAFMNLDNETFAGYLEYGKKYTIYDNIINDIKPYVSDGKSPKETLALLNRIGSASTFKDYINLRTQYLNYFDNDEAESLKSIYKIFPGKAKKFRYLRPKSRFFDESKIISVEEQYNTYVGRYQNCSPVYNDKGALVGVYLDLTEQEHIKLLHDELSEFITAHQKEMQAKGFKIAAERLLKYEYTGKELSVVAPKESTELAIEGGTLSHCVAGFIDPVIKGTENVLFIRRNDMLNTPYYTMAISNDGTIEQIHSYRNGHLSASEQLEAYNKSGLQSYNKCFDIVGFLREWAKKKKGLVRESSIRETYGALGAHR